MTTTIDKVKLRDNLSIRIEKRRDDNTAPFYVIYLDSSQHEGIYIDSGKDLNDIADHYLDIIRVIGKE
jgi:hypothetical protein